jgi:hypothetical protein
VPTPTFVAGTSACVASVASNDATGTWNVDSGVGSFDVVERVKVFLGASQLSPCPTCVGDTPGDGVQGGTCSGGQNNGLSCEAQASDPTFPIPGGGFYSIDCMPNSAGNITGPGMLISHTETTGSASLASSIPCPGNTSENCQCAACSGNSGLGCSSNAECSSAGAGTCTASGGGVSGAPNACDFDDCNAGTGGEAQCGSNLDHYCDGLTEEDGKGVFACFDDTDCDAASQPGLDAGACTIAVPRDCFLPTISATGVADADQPRTVAVTCVPPTSNNAVNSVFGLPGPGRVRTDWFATYLQ